MHIELNPDLEILPPPPPSDVDRLRARLDELVSVLGEWPPEMIARGLVAKACDISLAASGMPSTIWMTQRATDLLAGHWSSNTIEQFVGTKNR